MNQGLMRAHRLAVVAITILSGGLAVAQPKTKDKPKTPPKGKAPSACGVKIIPLVVGNEWTYEPTAAPVAVDESIKRFVPPEPTKINIKVTSIDAPTKAGGDTTVNLEETTTYDITRKDDKERKYSDRKIKTTIVCNQNKKFDIAPDSFFFAGEPGGAWDLTFDKLERTKGTFTLVNGGIGEAPWAEDIAGHFTRTARPNAPAKLLAGKLELERRYTPGRPSEMNVKIGGPYHAETVQLKITGRVTLEGGTETLPPDWTSNDKTCSVTPAGFKCELPANWVTLFWMSNDVGFVRTQNTYAHVYDLSDAKLQ